MKNVMLIVDDTQMNREILKILFHNEFEIMQADNGTEAIGILEACRGSIDIVLLDLVMPGLSGFDMLEKRKELDCFKEVPVVVITSSGTMEDQIQAFNLGASDFIQKPFVPEIVVSRVNNVMASNRRMQSIEREAKTFKVKSELDGMTGLYNKTTTELLINEQLKNSRTEKNAMLIIDIDHFKHVNDSSGHQVGDHVIKIIADLISSKFRKSDIVGRIGGDEFCVLMTNVPSVEIVRAKAAELIQIMRYKPNLAIPEYVTLSIGVTECLHREISYPEMFKEADSALYAAKENGRAQYRVFGVTFEETHNEKNHSILLISSNRNVCSVIGALAPMSLNVIEALTLDSLKNISEEKLKKVALIYADVSDVKGDASEFWDKLKTYPWVDMSHTLAICEEMNTMQYKTALDYGVADLVAVPIEEAPLKRRTMRHLEKFGIIEPTVSILKD